MENISIRGMVLAWNIIYFYLLTDTADCTRQFLLCFSLDFQHLQHFAPIILLNLGVCAKCCLIILRKTVQAYFTIQTGFPTINSIYTLCSLRKPVNVIKDFFQHSYSFISPSPIGQNLQKLECTYQQTQEQSPPPVLLDYRSILS